MSTDLPKNILKIIVALLKHQAENVLGKDAISIAGKTIVDIGGEKTQAKIDAILNTGEGAQKLVDAALRADSYFREKCADKDLQGIFSMPMGDLPSIQIMLKDLPNALDQAGALKSLRENLEITFPRLNQKQIEYCATLYLDCLNRVLLPLKDFTLPIIGQTVLESKEDIKDIKIKIGQILHAISPQYQTQSAKLFICYTHSDSEDSAFAEYLYAHFTARGYEVFIDVSMRLGIEWLNRIDEEIQSSNYLIVLVSKSSAESEMVQAELRRAYEYRHLSGHPRTLPIRMKYQGWLPYTIAAFIGQIQQIDWNDPRDNERVADEIFRVISGQERYTSVVHPKLRRARFFSEDGHALFSREGEPHPLPEFDPRILEDLEEPGGSLKLDDRFYIERDSDYRLNRNIVKSGTTVTIRASRQTGKSSLLVRGIHHAHSQAHPSADVVYLDLQSIEQSEFKSADLFLKYLAGTLVRKLRMDSAVVSQIWRDKLGPQDKLVKVMVDHILPKADKLVILAIDEADRLLEVPFHSDFFALIRSWHNERALEPLWNKLNIAMVIATEPYLLISNPHQSPFNVGIRLNLEDFNREQVRELNYRHGDPLKENDLDAFFELLSGHPYLTRKALYLIVGEHWTWETLYRQAAGDQGPFADNLRRQLWFIHEDQALQAGLRQILHENKCDDDKALWRLLRAGLVKGIGDLYYCRCGLYEKYFGAHLK